MRMVLRILVEVAISLAPMKLLLAAALAFRTFVSSHFDARCDLFPCILECPGYLHYAIMS
ncbi:hypothetical protein OBBRIDRAFT_572903 [Obba rivulosa]|uniref:Uncharacterized protein n=1 Tax=Obba rivulosa TaxID=1052685 RepID=A0A8E2J5Y3_9APHY|nr:hypothetical protein OBBRIDRAFT_572903 [Obba rivulosa]